MLTVNVVYVKFKKMKTIQYFNPGENMDILANDIVIVETYRGVEAGVAMSGIRTIPSKEVVNYPLRDLVRKATPEDIEIIKENKNRELKAFDIALKKIYQHDLPMKLIDVEYLFDRKKIIFYFSAEGRIDFRKLVKDLASTFKTRIELHQIGVRDEARMLGGIAHCGKTTCCSTYLNQFTPVSIKMAKEQSLSLNPIMISGLCGRLMCCLKYEYDVYREIKADLPPIGSEIIIPEGRGIIIDINVPKRQIVMEMPNSARMDLDFSRVRELEKEGKVTRAKINLINQDLDVLMEEEDDGFSSFY